MGHFIALTGGIACGKSTVSNILRERGWEIIDVDEIAHQVLDMPEIQKKITDTFGSDVLIDGKIHRKTLGKIVFSDANKLASLNAIVHPETRLQWESRVKYLQSEEPSKNICVDIPLLFEMELDNEFILWRIWCVTTGDTTQMSRMIARGHSQEEAERRVKSQLPLKYKSRRSDVVIWNNGTPDELRNQVKRILQEEYELI